MKCRRGSGAGKTQRSWVGEIGDRPVQLRPVELIRTDLHVPSVGAGSSLLALPKTGQPERADARAALPGEARQLVQAARRRLRFSPDSENLCHSDASNPMSAFREGAADESL